MYQLVITAIMHVTNYLKISVATLGQFFLTHWCPGQIGKPLLSNIGQFGASYPCFSSSPRTGGLLPWQWKKLKRHILLSEAHFRSMHQSIGLFNHVTVSMEDLMHVAQDAFLILYFLKISLMDPTQRALLVSWSNYFLICLTTTTKMFHNLSCKVSYFQSVIFSHVWRYLESIH